MDQAIKEDLIAIDGTHTRALSVDGEGPPVLLLHGFSDSADTWRPVLLALARAGRRAIAVDLPGSGAADPLPRTGVLAALNGFTAALVDAHPGAVLAGNSLGGLLAMRAAEDDATPLSAIVPISPAGLAYHPRAKLIEGGSDLLIPWLRLAYRTPVPPAVLRSAAERMYRLRIGGPGSDPELARLYAGHFTGMRDLRRFGRIARLLADDMRAEPLRLDRIGVPVLLVWGGHDAVCDVAGADALLAVVPDSRLVVLEDCGHCPQAQRPDEIARLLLEVAIPVAPARPARA